MKKLLAVVTIIFMLAFGGVNAKAEMVATPAEEGMIIIQEEGHKYYSVNGATLDFGLQDYIYDTLASFDMAWYFPTFLCQIYQESRYDQGCMTAHANGTVDVGLCQLKDRYHSEIKAIAGLSQDANFYSDPYANLLGGMAVMRRNWMACWDINVAISTYLTGSLSQYSETYVNDVRKWEYTLMEVQR